MSYLRARVRVARRYEATSLSDLLHDLDLGRASARASDDDLERTIRLAERVARRMHVDLDTCLFRGLSRYATARAAARDVRFVMGVDRDDPSTGHAWIEVDGRPMLESDVARYLPTLEHPPRRTPTPGSDVRDE